MAADAPVPPDDLDALCRRELVVVARQRALAELLGQELRPGKMSERRTREGEAGSGTQGSDAVLRNALAL
jgi:hypothetical protein